LSAVFDVGEFGESHDACSGNALAGSPGLGGMHLREWRTGACAGGDILHDEGVGPNRGVCTDGNRTDDYRVREYRDSVSDRRISPCPLMAKRDTLTDRDVIPDHATHSYNDPDRMRKP